VWLLLVAVLEQAAMEGQTRGLFIFLGLTGDSASPFRHRLLGDAPIAAPLPLATSELSCDRPLFEQVSWDWVCEVVG